MVLLLETGLRIGEVAILRRDQVVGAKLRNVIRKGESIQNVLLSEIALYALTLYLDSRSDSDPLLYPWNVRTLRRWVYEVSEMAGKKINPHRLRHTFALGILRDTKDIRLVSQLLDHKSIQSTLLYTERDEDELYQVLNRNKLK